MAASGVNQFHYFNPCACARSLPSVLLLGLFRQQDLVSISSLCAPSWLCAGTFGVTMREHALLQSVLDEATAYVGCAQRRWIVDKQMRWQDDIILTGATLGLPPGVSSTGTTDSSSQMSKVWRVTPLRPSEFVSLLLASLPPQFVFVTVN